MRQEEGEMGPAMGSAVEPSSEVQNGLPRMENSDLKQVDHPSSSSQEDFYTQMLSGLAWEELNRGNIKPPWEPAAADGGDGSDSGGQKIFGLSSAWGDQWTGSNELQYLASHAEPGVMAPQLQEQGIIGGGGSTPSEISRVFQRSNGYEQQRMLLPVTAKSIAAGDLGFLPLPLSQGGSDSADSRLIARRSRDDDADLCFRSPNSSLCGGFSGSLQQEIQTIARNPQVLPTPAPYNGGAPAAGTGQTAPPPRQRVRAKRGQATDPHSIAERLRRERIAERMKALQELVPNPNKTDKASMLDEIIDYIKFLQLQVKVMSMSRLGTAAAAADTPPPSEAMAAGGGEDLAAAERLVAELMGEDLGAAMKFLQARGLCLMPISLAAANPDV
ncbi:unnamed protein product [Spirodela intermedia]|uniref:BHLH domain-containing protein n=1 Tax=Spirodela intermedia TaxID=51605 RepID=A0A7I8JQ37_SPIIN|nr:unnamed protein product [Spirodela intermedia]CAA6672256.1 unnamed protein product [Spirodela intermedia]